MTEVLNESIPTAYYGNEPISPTAVSPAPVIPPEPPAEDDLADELQRASKPRERTSQSAGSFSVRPSSDALFGLEQSSEAKEEGLSGSLQKVSQYVPDISQSYNIYSMRVAPSMWKKVGNYDVWHQRTEHPSWELNAVLSFEQIVENATEEDLSAPLANVLRDLREINDEAEEEGIPPPSELAIANADRLIRASYDILPRQYLVELLPEGVIAITIPGGFRCSVMLLCESEGGILCSVNMNGKHQRNRYTHVDQLPDRFLRDALSKLGRE